MVTVKHPEYPSKVIPEAALEKFLELGWELVEPAKQGK
jgi:hypothetical protein